MSRQKIIAILTRSHDGWGSQWSMQKPSRADPRLCWAACLGWPSGPCCTYSVAAGGAQTALWNREAAINTTSNYATWVALLYLKVQMEVPMWASFLPDRKIMNTVVFLQGNPATEQPFYGWGLHSVLHMDSSKVCLVPHNSGFSASKEIQDYLCYSLFIWKQNFQCYFIVSKCLSYSDNHRAASPSKKQSFLFNFMAPVSGSSHASL